MNLLQLRTKFVQMSGRYDLVVDTTSYVDNGANFYINSGQRFLEKRVKVPENTGKIFEVLAIGEYAVTFQHHCRAIQSVYAESLTERFELKKITLDQLKSYYTDPVRCLPIHQQSKSGNSVYPQSLD